MMLIIDFIVVNVLVGLRVLRESNFTGSYFLLPTLEPGVPILLRARAGILVVYPGFLTEHLEVVILSIEDLQGLIDNPLLLLLLLDLLQHVHVHHLELLDVR